MVFQLSGIARGHHFFSVPLARFLAGPCCRLKALLTDNGVGEAIFRRSLCSSLFRPRFFPLLVAPEAPRGQAALSN